jgi:hypothetical protein
MGPLSLESESWNLAGNNFKARRFSSLFGKFAELERLGEMLAASPKNKGRRGQIVGSTDGSGGAVIVPPENDYPHTRQSVAAESVIILPNRRDEPFSQSN